jgi:hypothetical protein
MTDLKNIPESLLRLSIADGSNMEFPRIPMPPPNPLVLAIERNYASEFYKRLASWISAFDAKLDQAHEVGVRLVSFGQNITFHLGNIGYSNPSLISFSGVTEDGSPVELIQHVSQISVLLMRVPRKDPTAPKRPIGFSVEAEEKQTGENPQG